MSQHEHEHHKKKKHLKASRSDASKTNETQLESHSEAHKVSTPVADFFLKKGNSLVTFLDEEEDQKNKVYPTFKAINTKPSRAYSFLYYVLTIMLTCFIIWAGFFEIDAYIHAKAEVETFSKINTITSPETNVIEKIHVSEGDAVKAGELLITFDKATQEANTKSVEKQYFANLADLARLDALLNEKELQLPEEVTNYSSELVQEVSQRFKHDKSVFGDGLSILDQKIAQQTNEISKLKDQIKIFESKQKLLDDELTTLLQLEAQGLVTRMRLLDAKKQQADNASQLGTLRSDSTTAESALQEIKISKDQYYDTAKKQFTADLAQARTLQNQLKADFASVTKKLERSQVVSPIDGIVYKIPNTTTSSSIQAGEEIISLVPLEDSLIVKASVRPEDIGLIQTGQEASVKITAFDYAIYGLLKGRVVKISPETFTTPGDTKPFFHVEIKTDSNYLTHHKKKFFISPGMQANVDIMIDRRTVLQYITNPFIKTVRESLKEK